MLLRLPSPIHNADIVTKGDTGLSPYVTILFSIFRQTGHTVRLWMKVMLKRSMIGEVYVRALLIKCGRVEQVRDSTLT